MFPSSSATPLAGSLQPARSERLLRAAPWATAISVMVWALWAVAFNTAQFGDNLEQFNWSHSLEWGYYKHPPMPTWLLGSVIQLFGPSRWWAIVLAAACALGTAMLTGSIAKQLLGARAAAAVLLLWSLQLCFSARVQLYNHNTVLVLFIAATVWCALRTQRGGAGWWIATGACAGAAMLSKYQALVPLGGLLLALAGSGRLRTPAQRFGLALAVLVALMMFVPHMSWVANHDFTTLRYVSESFDPEGPEHRLKVLLSFIANQLRMVFPALATVLICWLMARRQRGIDVPADPAGLPAREVRIWLFGLIWAPLLALVVLDLAGGVTLRNHWGVQTMQFVTLWMAWRWQRFLLGDLRRLIVVAFVVQCMGLGLYAVQQRDPDAILSTRRMDTVYPAQRMADAAMGVWRSTTSCPLRFVAGPSFQAGLISLYSGGTAAVFEGATESPWIDPAEMRRQGALYVVEGEQPLPRGIAPALRFSLAPDEKTGRGARSITIGVQPPEQRCS